MHVLLAPATLIYYRRQAHFENVAIEFTGVNGRPLFSVLETFPALGPFNTYVHTSTNYTQGQHTVWKVITYHSFTSCYPWTLNIFTYVRNIGTLNDFMRAMPYFSKITLIYILLRQFITFCKGWSKFLAMLFRLFSNYEYLKQDRKNTFQFFTQANDNLRTKNASTEHIEQTVHSYIIIPCKSNYTPD